VECLLVRSLGSPHGPQADWEALVHPGQKLKPGTRVAFEGAGLRLDGEITDHHFHGRRTIRLTASTGTVMDAIERIGHIPLPPYIKRPDDAADRERYQTVFASEAGSIAAPTAGLHFTQVMLDTLRGKGVGTIQVTLHVGYGTFKPVRVDQIDEHRVDPELFSVSADAALELTRAQADGRRIIAVGTTTTRVLETVADESGGVRAASGSTDLFIRPGHQFRLIGGLLTNFHLPRSSLLMLVAAFGGRDTVLDAYREAVERGYRFYSYGDAMLIL
jgi:S-adenosylmethionine:tRNA ribosyltransferase-isomerase